MGLEHAADDEPTDDGPGSPGRKARGIQSIVIGFAILEKIADAATPLALRELSALTGMAASKLRFYLVSFMDLGLVSQDPASTRYSLGPAALRLGLSALERVDVVRICRAEMVGLADSLGYTVFLAVWGTHGPTIVDRVDGRNRTVLEIRVGSVLPLSSSAIGLVYAAFLPQGTTQPLLERETLDGIGVWPPKDLSFYLSESLEQTRMTRFACASGTLLAGFTAVASPILDRSNLPVAAISVIGPIGKMDDRRDGIIGQHLLQLTERISVQIGWSMGKK
ncbi:IclR family transcriptional regulator [Paraburkholderia agricolaris]|uniref:IclR family transcriptional regulator n=1 Tax=Paraburkholderia agricolaris TaxID=2152888 RepID=A0ABW8ZU06_9BURK